MRVTVSAYRHGEPMTTRREERKEDVLAFMRSQKPVGAYAGWFEDEITGEEIAPEERFESGDFAWSNQDVYHLEKYDVELRPQFVQYALANV